MSVPKRITVLLAQNVETSYPLIEDLRETPIPFSKSCLHNKLTGFYTLIRKV